MVWFLLIFIVIDIIQTLYIRHLKQSDKTDKGSVLDLIEKKDCRSSPKRCGY